MYLLCADVYTDLYTEYLFNNVSLVISTIVVDIDNVTGIGYHSLYRGRGRASVGGLFRCPGWIFDKPG